MTDRESTNDFPLAQFVRDRRPSGEELVRHKRSPDRSPRLTAPERSVWREAFCAAASSGTVPFGSHAQAARLCADFAAIAVREFQRRILWAGK